MKHTASLMIILFVLAIMQIPQIKAQGHKQGTSNLTVMVKQMTLEEKVGQMAQVSIESLGGIQTENFLLIRISLRMQW